jgi:hypothetical protein
VLRRAGNIRQSPLMRGRAAVEKQILAHDAERNRAR